MDHQSNTTVYVSTQNDMFEFNQVLLRNLEESGRLVDDANSADNKLEIVSAKWQKRIASVGDDGVASEYTLSYRIIYNLDTGTKELSGQSISAQQDYSYNRNQLLSVDSEESQIKQSLSKQLALRMLRVIK